MTCRIDRSLQCGKRAPIILNYSPNDEHWILKRRIRPLFGDRSIDRRGEVQESVRSYPFLSSTQATMITTATMTAATAAENHVCMQNGTGDGGKRSTVLLTTMLSMACPDLEVIQTKNCDSETVVSTVSMTRVPLWQIQSRPSKSRVMSKCCQPESDLGKKYCISRTWSSPAIL